jgi:hypothetical protein
MRDDWEHQERASWGLEEMRDEFRTRLYKGPNQMTKPETRDSGLELPDKPGEWKNDSGLRGFCCKSRRKNRLVFIELCEDGTTEDMQDLDAIPRGHWFPAVPAAPAPEWAAKESGWVIERHINSELRYFGGRFVDDRGFSSKHEDAIRFARQEDAAIVLSWLLSGFGRVAEHVWRNRSPAEGELARVVKVKGRTATVEQIHGDAWAITNSHDRLNSDNYWVHWSEKYAEFGSQEEAAAFLAQHADQPAAVSPDASAEQPKLERRFQFDDDCCTVLNSAELEKMRQAKSDLDAAAPAEPGDDEASDLRDSIASLNDPEPSITPQEFADRHGLSSSSAPAQEEGQSERDQQLRFPRSYYEQQAAKQEQTINELREQLAAAENRISLAGGYHERTSREIAIDDWLCHNPSHIPGPTQSDIRYLLDLVDAGRNRVHEEISKREAAEAELASLKAAKGETDAA